VSDLTSNALFKVITFLILEVFWMILDSAKHLSSFDFRFSYI